VLALSGSTREGSFNTALLQEAVTIAKDQGAEVTVFDLKTSPLPFFSEDIEKNEGMPENARLLREMMIQSEAIFIATCEYNGYFPGILKNALDWATRTPEGTFSTAAIKGKRFLIVSASPGAGGGRRAAGHLKAMIEDLGGIVITEPISVGRAHQRLGTDSYRSELESAVEKTLGG